MTPQAFRDGHRASRDVVAARAQAPAVARRLGSGLREARLAARLDQADVAHRVGVSSMTISRLERGVGSAPLALWMAAAAGVGRRLAVYLEATSSAELPRDVEHLKRQRLVIETARSGGWKPGFETPTEPFATRSPSVDVVLTRPSTGETVLVEVWDWLADVGEAVRSSDAKLASMRRRLGEGAGEMGERSSVETLWVLRGTRRNRELVTAFAAIFETRFPGSSAGWMRALTDPTFPIPNQAGLVWTDVPGGRLIARRHAVSVEHAILRDGPADYAKHPR